MNNTLYIVRGIPGSGKSTLAKTLGGKHYEADMFFIDGEGNYNFDFTKIKDAHQWCQGMVKGDMILEYPKIVVSNTFTQEWEMQTYIDLAKKYGYQVTTLIIENRHGNSNVHNVPTETLDRMRQRFEVKL